MGTSRTNQSGDFIEVTELSLSINGVLIVEQEDKDAWIEGFEDGWEQKYHNLLWESILKPILEKDNDCNYNGKVDFEILVENVANFLDSIQVKKDD